MGNLQSTVQQLQKLLPNLKKEERQISKFLYQKLALGNSVPIETIANELQIQILSDHEVLLVSSRFGFVIRRVVEAWLPIVRIWLSYTY